MMRVNSPDSIRFRVNSFFALTKPGIIRTLLITTVPTMFVAEKGTPSLWLIVATMVGGSLAAAGANSFNMVLDVDIDKKMNRTSNRPLVTGAITTKEATVFAFVLEVGAFIWLLGFVNLLSAFLAISATAFYVIVYTMWLKRSSTSNIVIGGAAGAVPVLIGWTAVTGTLGWAPIVLFSVIFFWTPPHFWALSLILKDDYAEAGIPMMPVTSGVAATKKRIFIYTWLLLALLPSAYFLTDSFSEIFWVPAFLLTTVFIFFAWRLLKSQGIESAKPTYIFSLAYLALMFIASIADSSINL